VHFTDKDDKNITYSSVQNIPNDFIVWWSTSAWNQIWLSTRPNSQSSRSRFDRHSSSLAIISMTNILSFSIYTLPITFTVRKSLFLLLYYIEGFENAVNLLGEVSSVNILHSFHSIHLPPATSSLRRTDGC
jgi:hypothetical protein